MFRNKNNSSSSQTNIQSIIFTGTTEDTNPPNYEVIITYKDGTKSKPVTMSSYDIYNQYLHFIPEEYASTIKSNVERMRQYMDHFRHQ